jgi:FtsP/CotA-like multicopper oxidase with cupredoxin domain
MERRKFIAGGSVALAATGLLRGEAAAMGSIEPSATSTDPYARFPAPAPPGQVGARVTAITTPNGTTLPHRVVDGVKVYHLVAAPARHEFAPGLVATVWGYNGSTPGPTIEANEGDRVRIFVTNRLPEKTTCHWHGLFLPNGMDGVQGLNQRGIEPGETFMYEFPLINAGTFMYHPHSDEMTQIGMGLNGMFIVHPRRARPRADRDFAIMLLEFSVPVGTSRPDTGEMTDFNVLTMNGKVFPGADPLVAQRGQRVRIRFGNLSAMHNHPIHLHGYAFEVTGTDGGLIPPAGRWPETTVLVPVGSTRDVEFTANAPGDWAMHCHFTHHVMNQMGHGIPNMVGMNPGDLDQRVRRLLPGYMTMGHTGMGGHGEHTMPVPRNSIPMRGAEGRHDYIDMGGMFTVVKVRDRLASYDDPGWYENPAGTVATVASAEALRRNGIDPAAGP